MKHYSEEDLERYLLKPEKERALEESDLHEHLQRCALCRENLEQLRQFHALSSQLTNLEPTDRDKAFVENLLPHAAAYLPAGRSKLLESDVLDFYRSSEGVKRNLPQKIIFIVRKYPLSAVGFSGLLAAALALMLFLPKSIVDKNPSYAVVKGVILTVYNKSGEPLWTKPAMGFPEEDSRGYQSTLLGDTAIWGHHWILIDDLAKDGKNNVLLSGAQHGNEVINGSFSRDTLYCFDPGGQLLWKKTYSRNIYLPPELSVGVRWLIHTFFTMTVRGTKRLFVVAHDEVHSFTMLAELNVSNGEPLQTYWNTGWITYAVPYQFQVHDSSKSVIILAGLNDSYNKLFLAQLDPNHIDGMGPKTLQYNPVVYPAPSDQKYVLFSKTDIAKRINTTPYGTWSSVEAGRNSVIFFAEELSNPLHDDGTTVYTIGCDLKITDIMFGNGYQTTSERLLKLHKISRGIGKEDLQQLVKETLSWKDSSFVPYLQYWNNEMPSFK